MYIFAQKKSMLEPHFKNKQLLNCHGKLVNISSPKVMGILNITPDSFYANSRVSDESYIINKVAAWIKLGIDFIDLGAYSSRPGAKHISEKEEWDRLEPILNVIRKAFPDVLLSVDTFRSDIARKSIEHFKVDIINDISAGNMDDKMFKEVGNYQVPYIMMHMLGTPQNMQIDPRYEFILKEIFSFFSEKIRKAYNAGIKDVVLDPGFGFGKTLEHNYELLNRLDEFKIFELPLLVGVSRKSMIYKLLDTTPEQALNGTTVINTLALSKGANVLRVHDVQEAVETVALYQKTIAAIK